MMGDVEISRAVCEKVVFHEARVVIEGALVLKRSWLRPCLRSNATVDGLSGGKKEGK